ncbi:CRISPR-associated nuclease/helicase Cas3 subtype I-F/YPEST [Pigmentiphaga humi]|uniref:CRISPR-associated nuclease/helicase Cas3 subtype I-F/YPEST n=1 Tax=Pigmentiphaga humi TaxID=2478468 RepID=A0A3P4B0Z2_9BURK|nr:type I-F CRISPR-associated helicase Cas3f [Pigmentiphaga humi]VCU69226.1 CRISPR-associated nuclease/helicase Cas3 subtype I-F/YPEST [Pigmentiphaga humi]
MNVLLVSQCSKRAIVETRRILDQFAERRGDRTWQTSITQAGLDTLRRLLRKTARKNTAVACHWIRGRDHSELLWIVGDTRQFNENGATPTNMTRRKVLRNEDENDWHTLPWIQALSALGSLLHDLGKASQAFQDRLRSSGPITRNLYRHEWVSVRQFQAFVGSDDDAGWLRRLADPDGWQLDDWCVERKRLRDGLDPDADANKPFAHLPPLASAVAWLILTHHRLPILPQASPTESSSETRVQGFQVSMLDEILKQIGPSWNERVEAADAESVRSYWYFPHGLPVTEPSWRKRAARLAKRLIDLRARHPDQSCLENPYLMHLARLGLMLADHHYSTLSGREVRLHINATYPLHANTVRVDGRIQMNQTLDEHLLGVEAHASQVIHALPGFERHLSCLVRHKKLGQRSSVARFRWQDRAADVATAMRGRAAGQGAFIVNMASTGCGKTLANARIMNALADPKRGLRCAFAMGLRTLTLQTGRSFRDDLGLTDDALAIQVGGRENRELFEHYRALAEQSGSASRQDLLDEESSYVQFEGNDQHPVLQRLSHNRQVRSLLAAPVLVCTIDHLTPATESLRGGRQIVPMLRLMSGDLVVDEPDEFDMDDLPALTRLVHWAGLLGSRVLLSSATLPPALVEGLFLAYSDGRAWFQRNRGERPGEPANICCAWVDEFGQAQQDCPDGATFLTKHLDFVQKRIDHLRKEPVRRHCELLPLSFTTHDKAERREQLAGILREAALSLHARHHGMDANSGKRVSFGLIRMANIDPLFDIALALYQQDAPPGVRIHLCVYHSQFPLLLRSAIENRLDTALNRRDEGAVYRLPEIRAGLDQHGEQDHLFIVLGSPVTEVGRDHDYDWAVVEPSSMRSLIQLAGRVRRHRIGAVETPNLVVLSSNLRHFEHPGEAAFCRPGFEQNRGDFRLTSHDLQHLLNEGERTVIDARPRVLQRPQETLRPRENLVDLEHARLARQMLPVPIQTDPASTRRSRFTSAGAQEIANASSHWRIPLVWLTGVLPQRQPFRADPRPKVELVLLPNEDEDDFELARIEEKNGRTQTVIEDALRHQVPDQRFRADRVVPWGRVDFIAALTEHAEAFELDLMSCAQRFAKVTIPDELQGWRFHAALGFSRAG